MDQSKTTKGKKVGTDGLTKKERRALKLSAVTINDNNSSPTVKSTSINVVVTSPKEKSLNSSTNKPNTQCDSKSKEKTNKECVEQELNQVRNTVQEGRALVQAKVHNILEKHMVKDKKGQDTAKKEIEEDNKKDGDSRSKAELKAKRRAVQEAQRLAKASLKTEEVSNKHEKNEPVVEKKVPIKKEVKTVKYLKKHKVPLFDHLYFENTGVPDLKSGIVNINGVHSAFLRLGAQYSSKTILGSNARCLAMLSALKCLISDFTSPPKEEFCRSLESTLQICVAHINNCRPLAVSMTNALRHFKLHLTQINSNISDNDKRFKLLDCIETYIHDEIAKAGEAISLQVKEKIFNNDVILTYGCSSLITKILLDAHKEGKKFKVIVVDGRPLLEGREMLRILVCAGVQCTYVLINSASFVMSRVTKVLLGAHALLANGYVMSRAGTAQVALIANSYKKPVLVCCETYKFCERVQTDSFVCNEIGDPDKIVIVDTLEETGTLANWRNINCLTPLNLLYDVTPPDLVTAVVTELAFLPCTSVPVILRIRPTEIIT